jgi:hypothetical protein
VAEAEGQETASWIRLMATWYRRGGPHFRRGSAYSSLESGWNRLAEQSLAKDIELHRRPAWLKSIIQSELSAPDLSIHIRGDGNQSAAVTVHLTDIKCSAQSACSMSVDVEQDAVDQAEKDMPKSEVRSIRECVALVIAC